MQEEAKENKLRLINDFTYADERRQKELREEIEHLSYTYQFLEENFKKIEKKVDTLNNEITKLIQEK